jgi:Tol biopolymer transport system component
MYLFLLACLCLASYHTSYAQNGVGKAYSQLPIKPSRSISFTTDEGSYMDVQISPDGKTILFDLLGSLFLMPAKGGEAKQITRGLAMNHSPVWSPDGKAIAFSGDASGDRRLHVINNDGANDRVVDRNALPSHNLTYGKPQWWPDGKSILFGPFLYDLGGNKIAFKDTLKVNEPIIGFANGGNFFYTQQYLHGHTIITRYDRKSLQKTVVATLKHSLLSEKNIEISADGCWLTYLERKEDDKDTTKLIAYSIGESKERLLALITVEYPLYKFPEYSISADSKNVFIGFGGKIHKIELKSGKDEIIQFNATIKADMGPLNFNTFRVSHDSLKVAYTRSANVNSAGTQLVFSALNRVYIIDLPNGKPRLLAHQLEAQFCPRFSPDGKWIAYVSWSDTVGGHIWRIPSIGGKPEQLTNTAARYQYLNWSLDGEHIVVVKGDLEDMPAVYELPDQGQIITISIYSGKERLVADSVPFFNSPVFTADGSAVIYKVREGNQNFVIKKRLDNSSLFVLAAVTGDNSYRQMVVSPDQRFIVYTKNENLFLVPVLDTTKPTIIDDKNTLYPPIRFSEGGFDPHWEQGGKILSWSFGNKYYQVDPHKIVQMANKTGHERSGTTAISKPSNSFKSAVQPDRTVTIKLVASINYARGTIVLKNARVITMRGDEIIERGTIVIHNGRINAIYKGDKIKTPIGAEIVEVAGKTIIPGFVDIHAHYRISGRDVFPQQSWKFLINLAYGVTTGRDPASERDSYGCSELLQEGSLIGPRLYCSGEFVDRAYDVESLEEAESIVNNHLLCNGTFIKQYTLDTRMQRQRLLIASAKAGLNMTNEGDQNALEYLGLVKDGSTGVEHSSFWGNVYKDVITFLSQSGTYLTPTLQVAQYWNETAKLYYRYLYFKSINSKLKRFTPSWYINDQLSEYSSKDSLQPFFYNDAAIAAKVLHKGGKIGMGSHGNYQGIGAHFEIWALQMGGMTNMEALRCATLTGAEAIGIQKDLGSIEVGKIADLIILDKNPLDDIHNTNTIKYVMKAGVLYDSETLDEIWPRAVKCPWVGNPKVKQP